MKMKMDQEDKDFIEEVSAYIEDPGLDDEREDTGYTCRPEALKIAKISFDRALKEIDAAVRLNLKQKASEAKKRTFRDLDEGSTWCPIIGEICIEYSNLAIGISKALDTMDEWIWD